VTVADTPTEGGGQPGVVGTRMKRREDPALLTGESRFVADLQIPGALHAALVRSPVAHARIVSIDLSAALAMPGVVAAFTGADLESEWAGPLPCAWPVTEDMRSPNHLPVAVRKVSYVGDPVAVVVARSEYQAHDATDAVAVEYDPLPVVVDSEDAASDRAVIHDHLATNTSYTWELNPGPDAVVDALSPYGIDDIAMPASPQRVWQAITSAGDRSPGSKEAQS
jgi:aerobic carbon-monoxide dehydrogenase large subunit